MSTPTTPPENGGTSPAGTDTVVMVGGQDWDAGRRCRRRGPAG